MVYKKRNIRKDRIFALIGIILVIILIVAGIITYKHFTSTEYKLGKIGYNEKEIATLLKSDKKVLNKALENDYDKYLIPLTKQKYFLWKNFDKYEKEIKKRLEKSNKLDYKDIITKVNIKRNYDYYTHTEKTNMDKGNAILVNKYYSLPDKYKPENIVDVSNWYSYGNLKLNKEAYEAFKKMFNDAKKEDITLIINSGYRTYDYQQEVYDQYKTLYDEQYADGIAARPDFSEHQTGLALDIITYNTKGKDFDKTDAFKWLQKNAHKYGFILRYPKDKEDITGYSYESWHYRYLGKDLATKVKNSGLTYDEYYAYYLDKE
ncbi:MAG: M15 family metallopeptidase [Bacilli bacterium]|nr:M15 family metallopeptidase [Bacilli bacterium]